jgi:hypothetical protein
MLRPTLPYPTSTHPETIYSGANKGFSILNRLLYISIELYW